MDDAIFNRVQVLLNDSTHQQPDICKERQLVEQSSFPPTGYLSGEVFTDHRPIVHHRLPVPQPNCFPFNLISNVHPSWIPWNRL